MGVAIHVGQRAYEIGAPSFLMSFFSTICVRLEGESWGSRFPVLMLQLYEGRLGPRDAGAALRELDEARKGLELIAPTDVVWDFDDRSAKPPWGDDIAPGITSLANYFVTSDGKDLFDVLRAAIGEVARSRKAATIG